MDIIGRQEAIAKGLKMYFTGTPCKHGHLSARYVSTRTCETCRTVSAKKSRQKNREKNRDKVRDYQREYYRSSDKCKRRIYAGNGKRRAALRSQCPPWVDQVEIKRFYDLAWLLTTHTGIKHHVDHIFPLAEGGLHVPCNLQVIPASINLSKGARVG